MIDIFFLLLLAFAVFKGFQQGFIVAVFSFLAYIAGLAAATKLSVVMSNYLDDLSFIPREWLPFLSFALVMLIVIVLVKWLAVVLRGSSKAMLLGWLDRMGGILLYSIIYLAIFSVVLFYATQMKLFSEETIATSKTYSLIEPLGPKMINAIGYVIPVFRNIFEQLQDFFSKIPV